MLSVVVPVYNECSTIEKLLLQVAAVPVVQEIIVVDDCSSDGTREILNILDIASLRIILHDANGGKGAALRTGFAQVQGDIVIVQDADLEYDPSEYPKLIQPILDGKADVVYGSRFLGKHHFSAPTHYWGNRFLTWCTNVMFGAKLTDMETCYKALRTDVLRQLTLRANRFDIEPEITAQLLLLGYEIAEVPISYEARDFADGKKISWRDGWQAISCLLRYRISPQYPVASEQAAL